MTNDTENALARELYLAKEPKGTVILSHGAGAGNQHPFMTAIAEGLCDLGFNVVSINFPYMQQAYELDKKRPPNRVPALVNYLCEELKYVKQQPELSPPYFLMGKSMGGRISTLLDAQVGIDETQNKIVANEMIEGTIVLGYPFMPPGKPEKLAERMNHFSDLSSPLLILQGERDTFGNIKTLEGIEYPNFVKLQWINDGDHSFKPRKSSGFTEGENINTAVIQSVEFMNGICNGI